jgi:hypothetical protein
MQADKELKLSIESPNLVGNRPSLRMGEKRKSLPGLGKWLCSTDPRVSTDTKFFTEMNPRNRNLFRRNEVVKKLFVKVSQNIWMILNETASRDYLIIIIYIYFGVMKVIKYFLKRRRCFELFLVQYILYLINKFCYYSC